MQELITALEATFDDIKLSNDEKYNLRDLFKQYQDDLEVLNFVRNSAFKIVQDHLRQSESQGIIALKWLEKVIKVLDTVKAPVITTPISDAYFSPGDVCKNKIISCLRSASQTIEICVFTISDNDIRDEILSAHQRGVQVRVITDNDKANDRGSDVDFLESQGVPLRVDKTDNHMHHKFAIFDQAILLNGSFNWTRSASIYNDENITVQNDKILTKKFSIYFEKMWKKLV